MTRLVLAAVLLAGAAAAVVYPAYTRAHAGR